MILILLCICSTLSWLYGLSGKLTFNPLTDSLIGNGKPFVLHPPVDDELPRFDVKDLGFIKPAKIVIILMLQLSKSDHYRFYNHFSLQF